MAKAGELIIEPKVPKARLGGFIRQLVDQAGIKTVYAKPGLIPKEVEGKVKTVYCSADADYVVVTGVGGAGSRKDKSGAGRAVKKNKNKRRKKANGKVGRRFTVLSNEDIDDILEAAEGEGLDFVIIDVRDWKIIPLENIIAKLHRLHTKIFAVAKSPAEVRKMFSILEVGVDGVIFAASSAEQVRAAAVYLGSSMFRLRAAKVTDIREVGDGERVCVDTASMLHKGEGMLVGSRSNFLFLVHNESVGSSFTSPRPFRVNAGAVHCYTLAPDGTTKYLSEMETGSEVLILDSGGNARRATVGRSKIERRPMLMIKAQMGGSGGRRGGGEAGGIIAQDAETIRFVKSDGRLVSVTHLKKGDMVLVHARPAAGRHFGMEVADEYILEK